MGGTDAESKVKRIFFPIEPDELLKGWLLHCHKSRERHDAISRRLDARHRWLMVISAAVSVVAGLTLTVDASRILAQMLGAGGADGFRIVVGVAALLSGFLTAYQRDAGLGANAEAHRQKAEAYKALIWSIEQKVPQLADVGVKDVDEWTSGWRREFMRIEEQQAIVPQDIIDGIDARYCKLPMVFEPEAAKLVSANGAAR